MSGCVLLDVRMPQMDGLEVQSAVRQLAEAVRLAVLAGLAAGK